MEIFTMIEVFYSGAILKSLTMLTFTFRTFVHAQDLNKLVIEKLEIITFLMISLSK